MVDVQRCECCGVRIVDNKVRGWGADVDGSAFATECLDEHGAHGVVDRIRSRRAAAEGPREAGVFRVGDVVHIVDDKSYRLRIDTAWADGTYDCTDLKTGVSWERQRLVPSCYRLEKPAPAQGEASGRKWDGTPGDWPKYRQWMHVCGGNQSWILDNDQDCGRCGLTFAQANRSAVYPVASVTVLPKEPIPVQNVTVRMAPDPTQLHFGPDSYPANPRYGIERRDEVEVPVVRRNLDYELFKSAVAELLEPKMPNGVSIVTDRLTRGGYLLDVRSGEKSLCRKVFGHVDRTEILALTKVVALMLMAEQRRGGGR